MGYIIMAVSNEISRMRSYLHDDFDYYILNSPSLDRV